MVIIAVRRGVHLDHVLERVSVERDVLRIRQQDVFQRLIGIGGPLRLRLEALVQVLLDEEEPLGIEGQVGGFGPSRTFGVHVQEFDVIRRVFLDEFLGEHGIENEAMDIWELLHGFVP